MSISLLDQMEEEGVKEPLIAVMRHWLRLGTTKVCDCSSKHIANSDGAPHGQVCTIWNMVKALGLTQEVVDRQHAEALRIQHQFNACMDDLVRGSRTRWQLDRVDWQMGRDEKNPRSLVAQLIKAEQVDQLRADFAARTGKAATPENMNRLLTEAFSRGEQSLFGIDPSTYSIWRGDAVQPRRTLTLEVMEEALRTAAMQPELSDGREMRLYHNLSLEAASAPPLRVEYAGEFVTDNEEDDDGEA